MKYKNIIWDWNGTLLNDVDVSIKTMNKLLAAYNLPSIQNREQYRKVFCFPVKDYYSALGFDFEKTPFEELAQKYITMYAENKNEIRLYTNTVKVLNELQKNHYVQYIVSATEQNHLFSQMAPFAIEHYFTKVCGIQDHFAVSKVDVAKKLIESVPLEKEKTVFVGDSIHDWEVAQSAGCSCILIANGHQSIDMLQTTQNQIVFDIEELLEILSK